MFALENAEVVSGRLEKVYDEQFSVFVDYAHTPDGLEKTLKTFLKEGAELDKLNSIKIAEIYNKNNIESRANQAFENGIAKRNEMPSEFIEDKPTSTERADKEKSEPDKGEIEFEEEMRVPLKFEKDAFEESKPVKVARINKVDDKIVSKVVEHDSKDKEVDLSNYKL